MHLCFQVWGSDEKTQVNYHHLGHLYDKQHHPCTIQALFNSIGKVSFEVWDILPNENNIAILQATLMDVGTSFNDGTAAIATDKDKMPPALLGVTGWGNSCHKYALAGPCRKGHWHWKTDLKQMSLAVFSKCSQQQLMVYLNLGEPSWMGTQPSSLLSK